MDGPKEVLGENNKLKREVDSVDDFEHLGHDSSPLVEVRGNVDNLLDLKTDDQAPSCVLTGTIDNKGESVGSSVTGSFDQLKELDQPLIPQKMDSNLVEMADSFPDKRGIDDKLSSLMQGLDSESKPVHQTQDKYNIQSFMDNERIYGQETPLNKPDTDILDRYSDSDPDDEEYVHSKIENVPKTIKDPEFHESVEDFKNENFQELVDTHNQLPKKESNVDSLLESMTESVKVSSEPPPLEPAKISPEPVRISPELVKSSPEPVKTSPEPVKTSPEPVKQKTPDPLPPVTSQFVKEPSPEPVKEKTPEPVKLAAAPIPQSEPVEKNKKNEQKPTATKAKIAPADAEAIFCKMGLDTWFNPERLNPNVESLIYWRDPKKSGPVFGGVLLILLALTYFSLISVIAYLSLIALSVTILFRIYKNIVQAVQKTGDGHPFKEYLQLDVSLPQEKMREISEVAVAHVNAAIVELRRLFLVEDLVDSLKFGALLWTLTYLGAWFNGLSLIIIAWVALFTLPKVYETNKTQIDANLEFVRTKLAEITSKVKAAIPIGKKAEEKKEQ